jgi:very-short-patch-repair endonuclease
VDARIAEAAEERHGVLTTAELTALGLTRDQRLRRARVGRLHELYPSVYAVGHTLLPAHGRWRAAVLACGPQAVLSHRSAAAFWGIRSTARRNVDVTTPQRGRKPRAGIDLHRVRRLDRADVTERDHIRVTTVARTLVDLADLLDDRGLERALHESEIARVLDVADVLEALGRANGRRGAQRLLALLDDATPPTQSELERRFFELCRTAGLPLPLTQVPIGPYVVDFYWPEQRLVVETDGAAVHHTRRAFERDRVKIADLAVLGLTVVPITWRRATSAPAEVANTLGALLL